MARGMRRVARNTGSATGGNGGIAGADDGNGSDAGHAVSPDDAFGPAAAAAGGSGDNDNDNGTGGNAPARRGGWPKGKPRGKRETASSPLALSGIESTLISIHEALAAVASAPELKLEKQEAADLAKAIAAVNEHYALPALNPKHAALLALGGCMFRVYKPRVAAVAARNRKPAGKGNGSAAAGQVTGTDAGSPVPMPVPIADPGAAWFVPGGGPAH